MTDPDTIAICMATFEPDAQLFRAQVESLRAQTDTRWVCVISDDCSSPAHFAQIEAVIEQDQRFIVAPSPNRLGFYRNFERALSMIPEAAALVALCDQDDRWHPEKLAVLRAGLAGAMLVYCDQRLTTADGAVLRETLWKGRRNNHTNLASLLIANSITGAASLMRRELVQLALPFPEVPGYQFHDHWIGLVALAAGEIAYVDRPLYDYVQHRGAVFGDVSVGPRESRRDRAHPRTERWRAAYFYGYRSRAIQARILLDRCAEGLTPPKRRALERFIESERSPAAFAWLVLRSLRGLLGHNETLGSELELAAGIAWKWLSMLRPRRDAPAAPPPLDAFSQERLRRWRAAV